MIQEGALKHLITREKGHMNFFKSTMVGLKCYSHRKTLFTWTHISLYEFVHFSVSHVRDLYILFMYINVWSHLHYIFPSVDIKGVKVSGKWKQKVYGQSNKNKSRLRWPAPLPYWLRWLRLSPPISWFNLTNKPRYFRLNPANWLNFVTCSTSQC